jgi:DnaJ-class molecular chaperone
MARPKPHGAATRDTSRRKSSWLTSKRSEDKTVQPCGTCNGTGSSGWKDDRGRLIVCPSCRGFGY